MQIRGAVIGAALAVVVAVGLTGSSAAEASSPDAAPPAAVSGGVSSSTSDDARYSAAVKSVAAGTKLADISDVPQFGRDLCSGISDGATTADLTKLGDLLGVSRPTFKSVVALSVAYYCPA